MRVALPMPICVGAQDEAPMTAAEHTTAAQGCQAEARHAKEKVAQHEIKRSCAWLARVLRGVRGHRR